MESAPVDVVAEKPLPHMVHIVLAEAAAEDNFIGPQLDARQGKQGRAAGEKTGGRAVGKGDAVRRSVARHNIFHIRSFPEPSAGS